MKISKRVLSKVDGLEGPTIRKAPQGRGQLSPKWEEIDQTSLKGITNRRHTSSKFMNVMKKLEG